MSPSGTGDIGALRLRGARPGDEPWIKRVVGDVLSEFGFAEDANGLDADLNEVYTSYEAPGGRFLVLVDTTDTILGCGGLFPLDSQTAEVRKMYFLPPARGFGWGRRLLLELIEHARRQRYRRVVLETASQLSAAGALYRSVGFVRVERNHVSSRCDQAMALDL